MRDNPLQFATVREDPRLEQAVIERFGARRALLIASGGCTALALRGWFDDLSITAVDANPAQLAHVDAKRRALREGTALATHSALAEQGNFESLFRLLRGVIHDFVLTPQELDSFFVSGEADLLAPIETSKYWRLAFDLAFGDEFVVAMFGPDAVQHAVAGSYPAYFRTAIERGLRRADAATNPFLHHILSGRYYDHAPPDYFACGAADGIELVESTIQDMDFAAFDYIGLSNVMDWMSPDAVGALLRKIDAEARPGTALLWRQLNNTRPLFEQLGSDFTHHHEMGCELRAQDRSLFYGRIHVCHRH